ncbi:unnamed protein product [Prunus armeniaca]
MEKVPYANVVGCLMYAMVCTRPDIAQAISVVSRYMGNPGKQHWDAVKWILRYLKGSWRQRIMFEKQKENARVLGYVDADYAGDLDKRRSTSGYVFTCAGRPISWRALLQPITALSTTEAEYIALAEARKEAIWLNGLGYPDSAERGMRIRLTKCLLNPAKIAAQVNFVLPRPARMCNKCDTRN